MTTFKFSPIPTADDLEGTIQELPPRIEVEDLLDESVEVLPGAMTDGWLAAYQVLIEHAAKLGCGVRVVLFTDETILAIFGPENQKIPHDVFVEAYEYVRAWREDLAKKSGGLGNVH